MKKNILMAIMVCAALAFSSCKNGKTDAASKGDSTYVEANIEKEEKAQKMDFKTYFNTFKLGMTAEEMSNAMATLPEEGIEWEDMHINIDFEACGFDDDAKLYEIVFVTEQIGTGEYYFEGRGKFALLEKKDGALTYKEIDAKLERLANYIEKQTGALTADCDMQSYSVSGDTDDSSWCGTLQTDYYNGPARELTDGNGDTYEAKPARFTLTITTPDRYAN